MERCSKMIRYHDEEWGVPIHDDRNQFEFLMVGLVTVYSHLPACGTIPTIIEKVVSDIVN